MLPFFTMFRKSLASCKGTLVDMGMGIGVGFVSGVGRDWAGKEGRVRLSSFGGEGAALVDAGLA